MSTNEAQDEESPEVIMAKEQEAKKAIIIHAITENVSLDSPHQDIRTIAQALADGDTIECKVIAGGKTNFSYKAYLKNHPETAVFAKVCFPFALWNPDRSFFYDTIRTQNEFTVMQKFFGLMGGTAEDAPIATPYFCVDVEDMKVLCTGWADADEQLCHQFIDGQIDHRLMPKIARAFATLNLCEDFDPQFNDNVRQCMESMFDTMATIFKSKLDQETPEDEGVELMQKSGQAAIDVMIKGMTESYNSREALVHHDTHCFNVLVEKRSGSVGGEFGPEGKFTLCDWEMTFAGPMASDPGKFTFYPYTCSLIHAAMGREDEALDIVMAMEEFWDAYADELVKKGHKDKDFMRTFYRNFVGWSALMFFIVYLFGIFVDTLPLEGASSSTRKKAIGAVGAIGFIMFDFGFGTLSPDLTYEESKKWLHNLFVEKIESLARAEEPPATGRRRMSTLKLSGRRISDASLYDEMAQRLSINPNDTKRASVFDVGMTHDLAAELQALADLDEED